MVLLDPGHWRFEDLFGSRTADGSNATDILAQSCTLYRSSIEISDNLYLEIFLI